MREDVARVLARVAADEVPSRSVDLWAGIRSRLPERRRLARYAWLRAMAIGVASLLVVAGLAMTPPVRAVVQDVVQRFGLAFTGSDPGAPVVRLEATMAEGQLAPLASIEELRQQAPFPLRVATWLPEGLTLAGGSVSGLESQEVIKVTLEYRRAGLVGGEAPVLRQWVANGAMPAPPLLAAKYERPSTVHGQPAVYVHGGWRDDGQGDPETAHGPLRWDETFDSAYLTWEEDGLAYLLEAQGLGLTESDLVRIAESLRP